MQRKKIGETAIIKKKKKEKNKINETVEIKTRKRGMKTRKKKKNRYK